MPSPESYDAVFLDRDGVINEEVGIIRSTDQLRLISGSGEAIARLNAMGIPAIVITNQPVVARGWVSEGELAEIHRHLREMLRDFGATLDEIHYCPHHENANDPAYRTACECRKPRPGLIQMALKERNLQPEKCVMIGDRTVDLAAGQAAGCSTFLVQTGFAGKDGKCDSTPDRTFENLADAVTHIETCR
ncbi:MAG: HAD family hydrolase [Verrucomicrobiales bacterium]|nr:HAD family hydrolase [Verrucomicrobiales bacterium]